MFITIKNLEKSYGSPDNKTFVLKGIDCTIEKGMICSLLGPSGSGKSTLLNIMGGIDLAERGEIMIDGLHLEKMSQKELAEYRRKKVGFIFQFYNLIPNLTIRENIESGAYLSNQPLDIAEIIHILGLEEQQNKFPNQVSGGQQQRAGIGRALIKNPDLLLCDEPTGALDYQTAKEVLGLIQTVNKRYEATIIMATHNQALGQMSHISFKLHDGKIETFEKNVEVLSAKELSW